VRLLRAAADWVLGMLTLAIAPLTKAAFAPFGQVIETKDAKPKLINDGFAQRFDGLAQIDVAAEGGAVNISLFSGSLRPSPVLIKLMERHPLGSQLFMPLNEKPWLVVVCADPRVPASYRAFSASGEQGVNYARNTWHHPLLVLTDLSPFLVVDRGGPGDNLEEVRLAEADWLALAQNVA
jgi:ureidoglycolate lyase